MKIIERSLTEKALEDNQYENVYEIEVNGKSRICAYDGGEPEDNSLGRNLSFVYGIVGLMKEAFEAGKRGEELEILKEEVEEL